MYEELQLGPFPPRQRVAFSESHSEHHNIINVSVKPQFSEVDIWP